MFSEIGNNTKEALNKFVSKIISNAELKIRTFTRHGIKLDKERLTIETTACAYHPSNHITTNAFDKSYLITFVTIILIAFIIPHIRQIDFKDSFFIP